MIKKKKKIKIKIAPTSLIFIECGAKFNRRRVPSAETTGSYLQQ